MENLDLIGHISRPSTKWVFVWLTNVTFYIFPLEGVPIGSPAQFPEYLLKNKGLYALVCNIRGKPYKDNKCLFRCMALHNGSDISGLERPASKLLNEYCNSYCITEFDGVSLDKLEEVSRLFNVGINVYQQDMDRKTECIYRTTLRSNIMNLNLHEQHFSFVSDMSKYSDTYSCRKCTKFFKHSGMCHRHEKTCDTGIKRIYKRGVFELKKSIFEQLEEHNIIIPKKLRTYPFRAVFDIECMMNDPTDVPDTVKTSYTFRHQVASVSVCSNVPGYKKPKCFVIDDQGSGLLVKNMLEYLVEISEQSAFLVNEKFQDYIPEIENTPLKDKFESYVAQLPVLTFNGAKYDLKVIKGDLIPSLVKLDSINYVIKKGSSYLCISTAELMFLDIVNYIAPCYNYSNFLKAYGVTEQKSFWPYEHFTSIEQLESKEFPRYENFYSTSTSRNTLEPLASDNLTAVEKVVIQRTSDKQNPLTPFEISQIADYRYTTLRELFIRKKWKLKDLLIHYNNLDTGPFIVALKNLVKYYSDRNVDIFKEAISVPGIAERLAFKTVKSDFFTLFSGQHKDLFSLFKSNLVGGPAIIFDRKQVAGQTNIRHHPNGEVCRKIIGYDANSLYLGCMGQQMPCGMFLRRRADNRFIREYPSQISFAALQWLAHLEETKGITIQHARRGGEKRIGDKNIPVDGFCKETNIIYQMHGCYWHGCIKCFPEDRDVKVEGKWSYDKKYKKTQETTEYLKSFGYEVVEKWECEFKLMKDSVSAETKEKYFYPTEHRYRMLESEILEAVKTEKLFGALEVDVSVPEELKEYFADLPPIFKHATIKYDDIGEHMQEYLNEKKIKYVDRVNLIASMFGQNILLITPMINWLLNKGVKVTKIYQVIEFDPQICFKKFVDDVCNDRRAGDRDPNLSIIADTSKLIGNSVYGHSLMDKEKHSHVIFTDLEGANKHVNSPFFNDLEEMDEETFEVKMQKKKVKYDLPIQLGFFVYNYAKLRMLEFLYDFIDKHLVRSKYNLIEMDTDSLYLALSTDSIDDAIKPGMENSFADTKNEFFPRSGTSEIAAFDSRTPGLFKVEWQGDGFVGLAAKTYYCFADKGKDKYSSKGVNKKLKLTKDDYINVLDTQEDRFQKNRGFILKDNEMLTYEQVRKGLSYLYVKRKVLADGYSTTYLDL